MATFATKATAARKALPEAQFAVLKGSPSKFKAYSMRVRMCLKTADLLDMSKALKAVETATLQGEYDVDVEYLATGKDKLLFAILMPKIDDTCVVTFCADEDEDEDDLGTVLWHAMVVEFYHVSETQIALLESDLMDLERRALRIMDQSPYLSPKGKLYKAWAFETALTELDTVITELSAVGHAVNDARMKAALIHLVQEHEHTKRLNMAATVALTSKGKTYSELKADVEDLYASLRPEPVDGYGHQVDGHGHEANGYGHKANGGKGRRCWKCGKPGHIRRDCPEGKGGKECRKCGEKGHDAKDCEGGINFARGEDDD